MKDELELMIYCTQPFSSSQNNILVVSAITTVLKFKLTKIQRIVLIRKKEIMQYNKR